MRVVPQCDSRSGLGITSIFHASFDVLKACPTKLIMAEEFVRSLGLCLASERQDHDASHDRHVHRTSFCIVLAVHSHTQIGFELPVQTERNEQAPDRTNAANASRPFSLASHTGSGSQVSNTLDRISFGDSFNSSSQSSQLNYPILPPRLRIQLRRVVSKECHRDHALYCILVVATSFKRFVGKAMTTF